PEAAQCANFMHIITPSELRYPCRPSNSAPPRPTNKKGADLAASPLLSISKTLSGIRFTARQRGTRPAAVLLKRNRTLHYHFHSHDPTRLDGKEISQQRAAALPVARPLIAVIHPHARDGQHHAALQVHQRETPLVDG